MSHSRSSSAPLGVTSPLGFRAAGGTCGIKVSGKPDLTLIVADVPCAAAGVFTTNLMTSAPVEIDRRHLAHKHTGGGGAGRARAIICNSGNANASTGKQGVNNAIAMCRAVAEAVGCEPSEVLPSSTGVIGRQLPIEKITRGIADLSAQLDRGAKADADAARGIMTTDLVPKTAGAVLRLQGAPGSKGKATVTLAGIAKGSGMIAPNMATMLVFLTTDADITPAMLNRALKLAAIDSFNRISVDQHTSPSDTVLLLASGLAGNRPIRAAGKDFDQFVDALTGMCKDLAYQIVKDGEGATKVFRVRITGARTMADADRAGRAVVDSPLVKCAVHGGDPNWGRITTAAGYSGAAIKPQTMSLSIGEPTGKPITVFRKGSPTVLDDATKKRLVAVMKSKEIVFTLDLGVGKSAVEWIGCDLSRDYVGINADYTT